MSFAKLKILKDLFLIPEYQHLHSHDFFSQRLLIYSPLYLPDIEKGFIKLNHAISHNKKIFIFGDRDVDGVTSTAMIYDYLKSQYPHLDIVYKNSKDSDVYGISVKTISLIEEFKPDLVIFLDMGSSHLHVVQKLIENHIDVIIIDHHIPQITVPDKVLEQIAFINPHLSKVVLENENKISTSGLSLKFILFFELYKASALERILVFQYKNFFHAYQNGFFLGKFSSLNEIKDFHHQPIKKYTKYRISEISQYFPEVLRDDLEDLFFDKPLEFGKYLTCLSIELRKEILNVFLKYSTLAAIGMIADQVPLIGENRTIVKAGLGLLDYKPTFLEGLVGLAQGLGINLEALSSKDMNWSIVPVLNAAGRIGETEKAVEILLEKNILSALEKTQVLIQFNQQRKERTKKNLEILENSHNELQEEVGFVLFYHHELEPGVSGILATRLAEKYKKPAIWINPDGEFAKGSVRSWNGVNVLEMLLPLKNLFVDIGGHADAVGFTITYENIPKLKERLKTLTQNYYPGLHLEKKQGYKNYFELSIRPDQLGEELLNDIRLLEPFGNGNPELYFVLKSVRINNPEIFSHKHLKFKVFNASDSIEFILWNAFPIIFENNLDEFSKFRWDITGMFERNIYFPTYSNCAFRFYVKSLIKKESVDSVLDAILK
ncbi:MAG: DHH family phosphoesterase [Leptospiraceae bacterium]|nr:DHH family phosphoesterase [Leptospiraceae bacterium]MDW7975006.1 DHH family phosphoesterase [Leptospiraceae bacterium]